MCNFQEENMNVLKYGIQCASEQLYSVTPFQKLFELILCTRLSKCQIIRQQEVGGLFCASSGAQVLYQPLISGKTMVVQVKTKRLIVKTCMVIQKYKLAS